MKGYGLYINGQWQDAAGGQTFAAINPADGQPVAEVALGGPQDVDRAVAAAKAALPIWQGLAPHERGRALACMADLLRKNIDRLARLETLDAGAPLMTSEWTVRDVAARRFDYFAGLADKIEGEQIPVGAAYHTYTRAEPMGITGHIIPWNGPLWEASRSLAPALAAGNAVILKPSQEALLGCILLGELAQQAGLPDGLLNIVPGPGSQVGPALISHPDVRGITFTGSIEVGREVMRLAAEDMTRVVLELGGKAPNIVFADAELEGAAMSSLWAAFANAGQICVSGARLLLQRSIKDRFLKQFVPQVEGFQVGPGLDNPHMGPVVSEKQMNSVLDYIQAGKDAGARVLTGGRRLTGPGYDGGYFIAPTIFDEVQPDMRIFQEEIFGPVLTVTTFDTEEEAIALANDTPYGLAAGLWTDSLARAHRVSNALEAGQVYVNEWFCGDIQCPAGGYKQSGIGREDGQQAIYNYLQMKSVRMRVG